MIAIAIDDEPKALDIVRIFAAKAPFVHLKATFQDAFEALDFLQKEQIDLVFLDIKMPDISGLEFVRSIASPPLVIFTTAYAEHAVQSYDFDAVDYLLKPFALARFLKACTKAHDVLKLQASKPATFAAPESIFVKDGHAQIRVLLDEILYVEAGGNYVVFVTETQKIASRLTMNEAEQMLPQDRFIRVNRSFIVAKNKVEKFDRYEVTIGKKQIVIGINYQEKLQFLL